MDAKKAAEFAVVRQVAERRGGAVRAEQGQWPDAWIDDTGGAVPVEVVRAYERPYMEDPKDGAVVERERRRAEMEALRLIRADGKPRAWGAHPIGDRGAEGYVVTLDDTGGPLPLLQNPANPVGWLLAAIQQKLGKHYAEAAATILVVDYQWMPPAPHEVRELGAALERLGVTWSCPGRADT